MRKILHSLTLCLAVLLAGPASAFDIEAMSPDERQAFRDEIRAYLLDNPEVLVEAIGVLEQRQSEEQATDDATLIQTNAEAIFEDGHSWVGGNPEGDVTLVEFIDYACSFCKRAHPEVMELLESDGNIRFIAKEFPILGPQSDIASRFAIAVLQTEDDDTYEEVLDRLMTLRGGLNEAAIERLAEEMGLDMAALRARMDSAEVDAVIDDNRALAQQLGVSGTPTFVLGERILRGYLPLEDMRTLVEATRAE